MRKSSAAARAFSLIEVIITVGVISFALVGLLGLFPLALDQTRNTIDETRCAQLARMVFATLAAEPFGAAECFGTEAGETLDLSNVQTVTLFASYHATSTAAKAATIVRTDVAPLNAEYRMELMIDRPAGGSTRGSLARLKITAHPARQGAIFESSQFLSKFPRAVFAK